MKGLVSYRIISYKVSDGPTEIVTIKAIVKEKEAAIQEFLDAIRSNREAVYAERSMRLT